MEYLGIVRFGDSEPDLRSPDLRRGNQPIKVQKQLYRLLAALVPEKH
jgi:DNA-binding winged helix-turn-helix (wHTH) protein